MEVFPPMQLSHCDNNVVGMNIHLIPRKSIEEIKEQAS